MQSWIHVIEWRANVRPQLTALVDDRGAAYTYAQLLAEVERKAGGWAGLVRPGNVVAVVAKNSADFLVHAFALMRAGATPAFVNWRLSARELTEVLTLVEPKAVAADAEFAHLVDAGLADAGRPALRVTIGGGSAPGALDGATLAGPVPPRPALTGDTVLALVHTSAVLMSEPKGAPHSGPEASGKYGLSIASHSGLPPSGIGVLAGAAERAGFSAVFVAEGHGDALSLCHPVAAATQRVRVGTAVANAALRPPVLAAKTAAQLDQATGGRFVLGLGVANSVMNARFGIPPFAPLPMIEEYVGVVRAVLRGQAAGYDGRVFRTGMVPLDSPPVRADLPIYLAALGPRMLELAGRIADGVILNLMTPAQAGQAASAARAAAQAAGRDPASVEIACVVHCCLSDDSAAAAAAARAVVPRYVLHPAVPRLFGELDGRVDLRGVRELVLAGDRAGAAGQVPQQVADGFVAHGRAAQCAARLADYRAAGVDLPVVFPMPVNGDWGYERAIAAMARV